MISREEKFLRQIGRSIHCKKVVNAFTGESEKKAGKQAAKEIGRGREAVSELAERSRGTLFDLFGTAQESRRAGLQGALDVFSETVPLRAQVAQGGNVAAQQALLAGLPEIQAAILGNRAPDLSALQPTTLPFELNFTNMQLPSVAPIQQPGQQQPTQQPPTTNASLLAGNR